MRASQMQLVVAPSARQQAHELDDDELDAMLDPRNVHLVEAHAGFLGPIQSALYQLFVGDPEGRRRLLREALTGCRSQFAAFQEGVTWTPENRVLMVSLVELSGDPDTLLLYFLVAMYLFPKIFQYYAELARPPLPVVRHNVVMDTLNRYGRAFLLYQSVNVPGDQPPTTGERDAVTGVQFIDAVRSAILTGNPHNTRGMSSSKPLPL